LRPDAQQTAVTFALGGNLLLVFVALPIGINVVMESKAESIDARQTSFERSSSVLESHMVLALLNERRAAAGLPAATHLLDASSVHKPHTCEKTQALSQFDSIWERVESHLGEEKVADR
jgi:hypothetical protein